jgi:hypothetical protein
MENYDNLYCKIFIDTECDMDFLINKINELVCGQKKLFRTIVTKFGEIDINKNEDFDTEKRLVKPDGFLYSRYYLDVEPNEKMDQKNYILNISTFLRELWKNGFKAIVACDFEGELPMKTNS